MTEKQKDYYLEMLKHNRMFTYKIKNRLACLITFYIGNENDKNRFVRNNMWSIVNDNKEGRICWIDHLITDKNSDNLKLSYKVWDVFKEYIILRFPSVKLISWNRWKNEKVTNYKEELR